jgi:transposase-like protein/uncharacterized protein YbaR (Trm112 family)
MNSIITYLLLYIHHLNKQISFLLLFIAKYIPLKQWAYDDSHSPKYQRFTLDKFPILIKHESVHFKLLLKNYFEANLKELKPVRRRNGKTIPTDIICPRCHAPHQYLYDNNGGNGQYLCKVCGNAFNIHHNDYLDMTFHCPYCHRKLDHIKTKNDYKIHKCNNRKCSYYLSNYRKVPKNISHTELSKHKLHYIYREPSKDLFTMDLSALPSWATSFKYRKNNAYIMGLCLSYHVNLGLSLRKTSQALKDIHGISVSHTMVANYAKTTAVIIKPFIDNFDYNPTNSLAADETYIKVRGVKGYVWFIMDAITRSILGYTVSDSRSVGPCILTMRMAFSKFKTFPGKTLKFIADGYSAYPLAKYFFDQSIYSGDDRFEITPVIGLSNDDAVSTKYRPFKQKVERLNRTFKASYRTTNGYSNDDGAQLSLILWVAYYNFLRPHKIHNWKRPLNLVNELQQATNMPERWQLLIWFGQQQLLQTQNKTSVS